MNPLNFLVSLITPDNDYQVAQAKAAEEAARKLGASVQIIYAGNDAINQSQQLLTIIQSGGPFPDAIVVEPVGGTGFPHVARAAVSAGIGWVAINREPDNMSQLRQESSKPVFCVSLDNLEAGRIQGQHIASLAPKDGTAIYIQGPSTALAARLRTQGMEQTKPAGVKLIGFKGNWTEQSAQKAICSWLNLSTSKKVHFDVVVAQNDDMAMGARKAFQEYADPEVRERWLRAPFCGCDGLPKTGQAFVRTGLMAATIVAPSSTRVAMEIFAEAMRTGKQPSELVLTTPVSFPAVNEITLAAGAKNQPAVIV
jgi:ribose transport system substrate-binding protein